MTDCNSDQTELKNLLRECAEALERHDLKEAMRLWLKIVNYSTLRLTDG